MKKIIGAVLMCCSLAARAGELASEFAKPPEAAKPLTWWHWLNGTITREGITADLESMKRAGLGGCYMFNCGVGMIVVAEAARAAPFAPKPTDDDSKAFIHAYSMAHKVSERIK